MVPRKTHTDTNLPNRQYLAQTAELRRRLKEDRGLLVYFYMVDWRWYLPAAEELDRSLSLHVLARENDGVIIKRGEMSVQRNIGAGRQLDHDPVRKFYDDVYYRQAINRNPPGFHLRRLARRFEPWIGRRALDVACGPGRWLQAVAERGAITAGIDISQVALDICRSAVPQAELHCGPAERLPFADRQFDFISCLGALEHFLDIEGSLQEMIRVAKTNASILLLVPNADFPPSRLGLYNGTLQAAVKEQARSLLHWEELFESAGLRVKARWKDLHIISTAWIFRGPFYEWPLRAAQAAVLPFWPLNWQYQVYYLCVLK
jgi:SAM-dependent methyltransferase